MNRITRIKINKIKGKEELDLPIEDGLLANKPNILVAPNGYGKSSVSIAIKSASHGALKLDKIDQCRDASIDITFEGEINENIHCDTNGGNLSRKLNLCVINDSIMAKSTGRSWGNVKTSSAEMTLNDVIIVDKIPDKLDKKKHDEYKRIKKKIDERLSIFNTTGRELKSHQNNGKLVVKFEKPTTMSNGERDILLFITMLTKFEVQFNKKVGLLVIDDIFDYLDGSNMLAVQYYISELIKNTKNNNKILYVIIFTHLDPEDFSNYYFSDKKICYLTNRPKFSKENIYKLIVARDDCVNDRLKEHIEKYFLHFHYNAIELQKIFEEDIIKQYELENIKKNTDIREECFKEITEHYLKNCEYDPLMVVMGLRLKIEENLFNWLPEEMKEKFFETHTTIKKMEIIGKEKIPELYFLLQPLYNDSMHLSKDYNKNVNKIKGCKLKLDNIHIKKMINMVFVC